jgi:hypothetical protein
MRTSKWWVILLGAALSWAQETSPPQTYSFKAVASSMGSPMTVEAHRNGSQEVIERTAAQASKFHDRVWYDFQSHRLYTLDLNSNICTTQSYESAYAPSLSDPVGAATETAAQMAEVPANQWQKATVNGIAALTIENSSDEVRMKVWVDEKYRFMVRMDMAEGKAPLTTRFEIKQMSYGPSAEALFTMPANCKQLGGSSSSTGGHTEFQVQASASGTLQLGSTGGATSQGSASIVGATQPAVRKSNVLGVKLQLEPPSYTGQCPAPIKLIADITTDGPGKVWNSFLAGAVAKNGPSEGTVEFAAAGTKTVVLEGMIPRTPMVPDTRVLTAMEDENGKHGPQTVRSQDVNYSRTCQK